MTLQVQCRVVIVASQFINLKKPRSGNNKQQQLQHGDDKMGGGAASKNEGRLFRHAAVMRCSIDTNDNHIPVLIGGIKGLVTLLKTSALVLDPLPLCISTLFRTHCNMIRR